MTFAGIRFGTSQQLVIGDATVARESVSEIDDTTTVTFETPPNLTHDTIHPLCLFIDDYGCAVLEK